MLNKSGGLYDQLENADFFVDGSISHVMALGLATGRLAWKRRFCGW